jgi:hypothetical protein
MAKADEMMRVQMVRNTTGEHRAILHAGSIETVPAKFGYFLIDKGKAVKVADDPQGGKPSISKGAHPSKDRDK